MSSSGSSAYSYSSNGDGIPDLVRKVLTPGDGETKPRKGDQVVVHYECKDENGVVFDSSVKRKRPFKFKVPGKEDEGKARKGMSLVIKVIPRIPSEQLLSLFCVRVWPRVLKR
jgi:hypothetical protein